MCSWLQLDPSVGRCVWPEANLISCGYPQNCGGNNCFRCARKRIKKSHLLIRRWDPTNSTFGSRGGFFWRRSVRGISQARGLEKNNYQRINARMGLYKGGLLLFLGRIIFADDFSRVGIPMTNLRRGRHKWSQQQRQRRCRRYCSHWMHNFCSSCWQHKRRRRRMNCESWLFEEKNTCKNSEVVSCWHWKFDRIFL